MSVPFKGEDCLRSAALALESNPEFVRFIKDCLETSANDRRYTSVGIILDLLSHTLDDLQSLLTIPDLFPQLERAERLRLDLEFEMSKPLNEFIRGRLVRF